MGHSLKRSLGHDGLSLAWDESRCAHLRADLDGFYARAYGLTRDELRYILYRTRRLVLAAWDRIETSCELGM
jgi:hypothetical protein